MIENFNKIKEYVLALGGFEESIKLDLQIQRLVYEALLQASCNKRRDRLKENLQARK